MMAFKRGARLAAGIGIMALLGAALLSLSASAEVGWFSRLRAGGSIEMTASSEPERIWPGWNPHHTFTLINRLDEPLTNLEVIAPVPAGLCLPQDGPRSSVPGAFDAERDAMVWQMESLAPGETLVAHVVWHSYSYLAHGQLIQAAFEFRADGHGGGIGAPVVVVDRAASEPLVYPTLTPTPSPSPSPTPATILRFEPEQIDLIENQTQSIAVTIESVEGLFGANIELTYDPTLLTITDADPDQEGIQVQPGNAPSPDFVARNSVNTETGVILYTVTQLGQRPAFDGDGPMLVISLTANSGFEGQTTLDWQAHELASADAEYITHRVGSAAAITLHPQPTRNPPASIVVTRSAPTATATPNQ